MRAVFLDRDGTINVDKGFTYRPEDLKFEEEAVRGLQLLHAFELFILTNQSGIGRGIFSHADLSRFHEHLLQQLRGAGVVIREIFYSPDRPDVPSTTRKPSPYFIREAEKKFGLSLSHSWMIGDRAVDVQTAKNAGIQSVLLLTGKGSEELAQARALNPDYIAGDLYHAARFIQMRERYDAVEIPKWFRREQTAQLGRMLRLQGKRVVSLNGTFDIVHPGHDHILNEARAQGDVLVVAINSDASVKRNKGPSRPLNTDRARALALAASERVDYVTIFDEQTPIEFIRELRPNVHVNGSEYGLNCIEAPVVREVGGRLHIVSLLPGLSSTKLLRGERRVTV